MIKAAHSLTERRRPRGLDIDLAANSFIQSAQRATELIDEAHSISRAGVFRIPSGHYTGVGVDLESLHAVFVDGIVDPPIIDPCHSKDCFQLVAMRLKLGVFALKGYTLGDVRLAITKFHDPLVVEQDVLMDDLAIHHIGTEFGETAPFVTRVEELDGKVLVEASATVAKA